MGTGYGLTCKNCGRSYEVTLGVGFLFPSVYSELVEEIEAGRYGKEWREIAAKTPHFAIDAEDRLFRCDSCGYWECAPDLSIYEPKDVERVLNTRYGEKTAREWGRAPYVMAEELKSDYQLVAKRVHTCKRCGNDMRTFSKGGQSRAVLKCHDCGCRLERDAFALLWD